MAWEPVDWWGLRARERAYGGFMGVRLPTEVRRALERGTLVVTAKERAARALRSEWDREQKARGLGSWEPAAALSWRAWTHGLWRQLLLEGKRDELLLNRLQERRVWEAVLREGSGATSLRGPEALAGMAAQAWRRLCLYGGQQRLRAMSASLEGDTAQFAVWAQRFRERCGRGGLLSEAELETELARSLGRGERSGKAILLVGFNQVEPAAELLLSAWREAGGETTMLAADEPAAPRLVAAETEREQLRGCARWVRARLQADPAERIAVVVAGLEEERDGLERVLREIVAPELEEIASEAEAPYEFSLGRPLDHQPMVQTALALLRWTTGALAMERIGRLLLSPYLAASGASDAEWGARAAMDAGPLRRELRLRPEVSLGALASAVAMAREEDGRARMPMLVGVLGGMNAAMKRMDARPRGFGAWAEWMRGWLALAQWPERREGLSSVEYQVRERWESALDTMTTLDFSGETVELNEAIETVERVVRETIFAPESREAAVQVLGPLEAAGSRFDAMWVLHCGELRWPPAAASEALLPWMLQRELGMPGSSAALDRERAAAMTRRLAGSAAEVVMSYARVTAEGVAQRAAVEVRMVCEAEETLSAVAPPERVDLSVALEELVDTAEICSLPDRVERGGVRLLELQAACGFRAFAEMRLGANELHEREPGLNAGERGNAVHLALQRFWSEVQTQARLRAMTMEERAATLGVAVEHGLHQGFARRTDRWDTAYMQVQRTRLQQLLEQWLETELARPEFTVMTQEEEQQSVQVGPLRLRLRLDRVDLVDGEKVVLDYKTGTARPAEWLGDRPDKPQVPLYAIVASGAAAGEVEEDRQPLGAVGFGEVRSGKDMRLRGFEARSGMLVAATARSRPSAMESDSFAGQVERWREVVERLAEEFAAGDARVRPKQYPTTCERCGQRLLCRVDASMFEDLLEDDAGETSEDRDG